MDEKKQKKTFKQFVNEHEDEIVIGVSTIVGGLVAYTFINTAYNYGVISGMNATLSAIATKCPEEAKVILPKIFETTKAVAK